MVRLMRAILSQHGFTDVERVSGGAEALACAGSFDIVLLDHELPDMTGIEAVGPLRSRPRPPSIVVVTAHGTEALAAAALRRGADDYLVKDASLAHLLPQVLDRVRRERALRTALAAAQEEVVRAERLTAIGEMTVTLHHEINNPLMAASAELDLLQRGADPLTETQRAGLEAMRESLERIRDIVFRMGSLRDARTTPYPGNLRMIDLGEDTRGAAIEVRAISRGVALVFVEDDALAQVVGAVAREAGYEVERCRDVAAFERGSRFVGTRLAVIEVGGALEIPSRSPELRTVALVRSDESARQTAADLVVRLPFDPWAFGEELAALGDRP